MSGMNNLATLIKRLEAACSRFEDIIVSTTGGLEPAVPAVNGSLATNAADAAAAVMPSPPQPSAPVEEDLPPSIQDFDSLVSKDLAPFLELSNALGGLVQKASAAFGDAFRAQRDILLTATKAKEPDQMSPAFMEILKELTIKLQVVQEIRERNRKTPEEQHLAMLAEGVGMMAWVTYKPKPDEYVADVLGGAQLYGNRILKEYKEKAPNQVAWVRSFVKLAGALRSYIQEHHKRGLSWKAGGIPADQAYREVHSKASAKAAPAAPGPPTGGAPPPPPPPPPPPMLDIPPPPGSGKADGSGDMGAVFADLNKGSAVTAGLKKVDKSQMTHKNPSLRAQDAGSARADTTRGKSPTPARKPEAMRTKKPPRKELAANKWTVENYEGDSAPVEINAEKMHSILISKCKNTTIRVIGKANAISIDNCARLDIIVDSLVSSADVINSSNFRMQIVGTLPAIQLDKVDVGTIYLSKESLETDIVTSKCSSINITLPPADDEADSVECPVPEQVRSRVNPKTGKLESEIVYAEG